VGKQAKARLEKYDAPCALQSQVGSTVVPKSSVKVKRDSAQHENLNLWQPVEDPQKQPL
jgi:hypothetical protein